MKPELQNEAIAEACGWKYKGSPGFADLNYKAWISPDGREYCECPNYTGDLNAMHEAEKEIWINKQQWDRYKAILQDMRCDDAIHATADQRAEAFLRTIGKWVEE